MSSCCKKEEEKKIKLEVSNFEDKILKAFTDNSLEKIKEVINNQNKNVKNIEILLKEVPNIKFSYFDLRVMLSLIIITLKTGNIKQQDLLVLGLLRHRIIESLKKENLA